MYQHFVTHHSDGTMNAEQLHNSRLIFFMAVTMSYNFMLDTIRKDPSLTLLTAISAGMKTNIEAYFDSNPQPVMNIH